MYVNDLEIVRMRHTELMHEAEEIRLAKEVMAEQRQQKKTQMNRPVFNLTKTSVKLTSDEAVKTTAELKRVPNTH